MRMIKVFYGISREHPQSMKLTEYIFLENKVKNKHVTAVLALLASYCIPFHYLIKAKCEANLPYDQFSNIAKT